MQAQEQAVALLTEGVDRNFLELQGDADVAGSPSSRRAWIEMDDVARQEALRKVALLTEGVDRNAQVTVTPDDFGRRPPHGGRG